MFMKFSNEMKGGENNNEEIRKTHRQDDESFFVSMRLI